MVDAERAALIAAAVDEARNFEERHPNGSPYYVCVGTSHTGTAGTVVLSQMAQDLDADAVMVTPVGYTPSSYHISISICVRAVAFCWRPTLLLLFFWMHSRRKRSTLMMHS